jgi:hypothetical protein
MQRQQSTIAIERARRQTRLRAGLIPDVAGVTPEPYPVGVAIGDLAAGLRAESFEQKIVTRERRRIARS